MEIYKSQFKTTDWDSDNSILANYWTANEMQAEDFKKEIEVWVELAEKHNAKNLLADTSKFNFPVSVELQEWTNNVVFPRLIGAGAVKFAIVESKEMLAQLSIEQTMEESEAKFQTRYFSSREEALKWLRS